MRIQGIKNYQTFKAHFYKVFPKSKSMIIQTDNKSFEGKDPHFIIQDSDIFFIRPYTSKTIPEGFYAEKISGCSPKIKYHVEYKDTEELDLKDGHDYEVDFDKMRQEASFYLRRVHNQPIISAIKPGAVSGELVVKDVSMFKERDFVENYPRPVIFLSKDLIPHVENPNVLGFLSPCDSDGHLSHKSAQMRSNFAVCGLIFDSQILDKLKKLDGENISLVIKDNFIRFKKTNERTEPIKFPKIDVPPLKYCDKILMPEDCTPDVIGAKAVNLNRLKKMSEEGKIDVIIPTFVALPYGYIEKLLSEHGRSGSIQNKETLVDDLRDLLKVLDDKSINEKTLIVRSSFNSEDLPEYCAAGLYDSCGIGYGYEDEFDNADELYIGIRNVALSKENEEAVLSRKRHQIPDEKVKEGVVIQNHIYAPNRFSVYTDDGEGNVRIEMLTDGIFSKSSQPNVFTYHRDTGELTYDSLLMTDQGVTFDEKGNIIGFDPCEGNIYDDKKLLSQIKKLALNALEIEKEFGAPQDIEGGIKGNDIYLWQTRNIVFN